ncbi:MAG: sugar transferase [Acidobacteriaceae bacterium]|jgi:lipopolysaccharide/colanic/teichoic acid biosynthesis glycosyltransferase
MSDTVDSIFDTAAFVEREVLVEEAFRRRIAIERKRTERSREPFLLMLLEAGSGQKGEPLDKTLNGIVTAMQSSTRETDVVGWYKERNTVGVMFTGLVISDKNSVLSTILGRVSTALQQEVTLERFNQITFSFHFFPDDWDGDSSGRPSDPILYPDLFIPSSDQRALLRVKRMMDIAGSAFMLIVCLPLFAVIALAVKLTSKGPILFRQDRIGQYGRRFTFLKFRSMRANNDESVHKEYVKQLIAGVADRIQTNGNGEGVFKLAGDKRITPIGKFLRKTSLDELPQFLNVLRGDMSLVGPRPPLPYELAAYQTWHRRRVLQVKPGITGLWQVTGRSRVRFDDMVRLDLRYAISWSPWLDFKILLRTPGAVIKGAY